MKKSKMLTITVGLLCLGLALGLRAFRGCKRYSNIQPEDETEAGANSLAKTSDDVSLKENEMIVTKKRIKYPRPVRYQGGRGRDTEMPMEEKERLELLRALHSPTLKNRKELLEMMVRIYWRRFKVTKAPKNEEEMEERLKQLGLYKFYVEKVIAHA